MNNAQEFYKCSGEILKYLEENVPNALRNFKYTQKKLLEQKNLKSFESKTREIVVFDTLVNIALVGLNREKIENAVETNWDDYKLDVNKNFSFAKFKASKIPYFQEWVDVFSCQEKVKEKGSAFWIKKIRDALMHGAFELNLSRDYRFFNTPQIAVVETNKNGPVLEMFVRALGFNEFVEDNFTNVIKDNVGIVSEEYSMVGKIDDHIQTRAQLEKVLDNIQITKIKIKPDTLYDGTKIVDKKTGQIVGGVSAKVVYVDGKAVHSKTKNYFDIENLEPYSLKDEAKEVVVHVLEKNNFYESSSQTAMLKSAIARYITNEQSIYMALDALKHLYQNLIWLVVKDAELEKQNRAVLGCFHTNAANTDTAFTILKLYRMLYAFQNKSIPSVSYKNLDFSGFAVFEEFEDRFNKKIDKKVANNPDIDEQQLTNQAMFDVIRDALSHGHLQVLNKVENDKLVRYFVFTDEWKNKNGEDETIAVISTMENVNKFLAEVDGKINAKINQQEEELKTEEHKTKEKTNEM